MSIYQEALTPVSIYQEATINTTVIIHQKVPTHLIIINFASDGCMVPTTTNLIL